MEWADKYTDDELFFMVTMLIKTYNKKNKENFHNNTK